MAKTKKPRAPKFSTVGELLYWSYANLALADSLEERKLAAPDTLSWMIRARLFKGLRTGSMDVGSLFADVRAAPRDRCVYCGKHDDGKLHADHLVPKHRGGLESGDNLVWACRSCNSSKGAKDLLEWYADRSAFPSVPLMRRYLKLALAEATSRGVMDCRLDECPSVTFSIDYIPTRYPTASAPRVIEKRERPRPD